jgi:hypothetical protein
MNVTEFSVIFPLLITAISPVLVSMEDSLLRRMTTCVVGLSLFICGFGLIMCHGVA